MLFLTLFVLTVVAICVFAVWPKIDGSSANRFRRRTPEAEQRPRTTNVTLWPCRPRPAPPTPEATAGHHPGPVALRPPECAHHRHCHRDLAEAHRLLSALLDEHLTAETTRQVEQDILHADDPAEALVALSATASILVVGASSDCPTSPTALGATTRAVLGRTRCPVVVVPHRRLSATRITW